MLLQDHSQRRPTASLSAARHWVNQLYAGLHDRARLEQSITGLGELLAGVVELIRITCKETDAVSEWCRSDSALPAGGLWPSAVDRQAPYQHFHKDGCLSLYTLSGAPARLLLAHASTRCEVVLLLRQYQEPLCPRDYGPRFSEVMLYTLPQLAQVNALLGKLRQPLHRLEVTHRLLQLVPLPLVVLNQRNQVERANVTTCRLLQRLQAEAAPAQADTWLAAADWSGLKFDSSRQRLSCDGVELAARFLFEEPWGAHPVRIYSLQDSRRHPQLNATILDSIFGLSAAETAVCQWVLAGQEPSDIARLQNRSINTIKSQLRSIYRKTGVQTTAQLARRLFFNPAYWVGRR
ncbi:helix-turn-helix transcriptional regulator [Ketobacter sp.]|uniref:helix-turn-helix transcriptional regulator n=1 Tax=Ketobacter sp. TaxID=2083498 RepID=UPI000F1D2C5B|nr:helix-turn-helix transcriptional regulator [Ketobacter sp.]RLT92097.1 MAG: LuxR family transcriptional regulator [Ketobacter sp.]